MTQVQGSCSLATGAFGGPGISLVIFPNFFSFMKFVNLADFPAWL